MFEITEPLIEPPIEAPVVVVPPQAPVAPQPEPTHQAPLAARQDTPSLFEVDDTLANLSRVAQELTQQKLSVLKQEEALEQRRLELRQERLELEQEIQRSAEKVAEKETSLEQLARTLTTREEHLAGCSVLNQAEQRRMDERARYLESEEAQVQNRERVVSHKEQQLTAALVQLPVLRENLRGALQTLDESLARLAETGRSQPESRLLGQDAD
jgi:chromosome segregation ATPase